MASAAFWRRSATVAIAAIVALAPLTASGNPGPKDLRVPREPVTQRSATWLNASKWFVEFKGEPTATGGNRATIARQHRAFTAEAQQAGRPAKVSKAYERLFNGMAVTADTATAEVYADLPSVEAIYPVRTIKVPQTQGKPSPRLVTAIQQTGADIAHKELGLTGEGIKVGIIDSGVDIDHPDFGGNGDNRSTSFPTARIAYGYDFVGDDYNADPTSPKYQPVPKPDANPDDCQGHGTHVAGIVGANGEVVGVAPCVTFGAYRVFGCEGSTDTQIILDALERAEADGMDVVNMSLGSDFANSPEDPTAKAADRLVRNGVVVVNSAGNAGDLMTMTLGSPGSSALSINVASFDNSHILLDEVVFAGTPTQTSAGYLPSTGSPEPTSALNGLEVEPTTDPIGCLAESKDLTGKVAITQRGSCTFHIKAANAQAAGASALVIYNNQPGYINATVEGETPITIPVVTIIQSAGDAVMGSLPATIEFTGDTTLQPHPTGGLISDFSSWGLASDLTLMPDLGAPGGSIRSTYPLEKAPYATLSGTSMAAPHVAGAVALMLDADATLTAAEIRDRLQNSAEPANFRENPGLGILDATHRQGAGLIQIPTAVQQQYVISPGKISAGESADGAHTEALTIRNTSDAAVTWTLDYEDAISTEIGVYPEYNMDGTQNTADFNLFPADVTFSAESVTVPAGGQATVDVTIDADPEAPEGATYTGFVYLTSDEGTDVSVPFAGLAGDYGNLEIFPEAYGLPSLVEVTKCDVWEEGQCYDSQFDYNLVDGGFIYEGGTSLPTIAFIQNQPVLKLTIDVLQADAAGNPVEASRKTVLSFDHVGRSGWDALYVWNGLLPNDQRLWVEALPGNYVIQVTGVEADGDGGSQSWTSPAFGWKNTPVEPTPEPTTPAPTTPAPKPEPVDPPDVYNTPGYHEVNGRKWFTACEPYSQTVRCRTMIYGTQVTEVNGKSQQQNGWVFNNLTYLPKMKRADWGTNPLANTGSWTSNGRQWRTECDTALTGRGGCRSFITASVIEAKPKAGGGYTYQWVSKEIFNNMVRFKAN